jgi:hypothetical protein
VVRPPFAALLVLLAGCAIEPGSPDGGADAGAPGHRAPAAFLACAASPGPVASIAQLLARRNALPRPVDGACLIASLQRPISVVASSSVLSLQPAVSRETPRLFVLNSSLVLSVVPGGDAGHLLEMGEWETALRTVKGVLELPVTAELTADAPFTKIKANANATTCGICHRQEAASAATPGGFTSAAFRPAPSDLVPVTELAAQHALCVDAGTVSERCDMFHAFFDFGEVRQGAFASSVELFIP